MAKKMIIKGVGTMMAKVYDRAGSGAEVITLGTLQDLRITMSTEIDDIFGGDSMFAIDTLVRNKAIEITATDAKFDLDAVRLMMGSTVKEQIESYVWVIGEQHTLVEATNGTKPVAVCTLEFGGNNNTIYHDPGFVVRTKISNKLYQEVPFEFDKTLSQGQFMYDATEGKLYFASSMADEDVVINYKREEVVDIADLLIDEIPFPVHVIHHGSFLQKDNTYAGIETELFCCRAQGQFSINAARATASASEVSLKVIDPERADGRIGTIKRYQSTRRV